MRGGFAIWCAQCEKSAEEHHDCDEADECPFPVVETGTEEDEDDFAEDEADV